MARYRSAGDDNCRVEQVSTHLGNIADDISPALQPAHKRSRCDEGLFDLARHLVRNVAERLEAAHLARDASQVPLAEVLVRVRQREHANHELVEERLHRIQQVNVLTFVEVTQVAEKVHENVGVLAIQNAVRPIKHFVKANPRLI